MKNKYLEIRWMNLVGGKYFLQKNIQLRVARQANRRKKMLHKIQECIYFFFGDDEMRKCT
jgi:hypothetical protein